MLADAGFFDGVRDKFSSRAGWFLIYEDVAGRPVQEWRDGIDGWGEAD